MLNKTEMYEAVIGVIPGYKPGEDLVIRINQNFIMLY